MATDYEKYYQEQRHALGEPTKAFVDFFSRYDKQAARVLDVGCGQGRDALFIARLGHAVVGVDISQTGIAHMMEDARREGLPITGHMADLRDYRIDGDFDVIVVDRTLHMLEEEERLMVLQSVLKATRSAGFVLIADEKANLPAMKAQLAEDDRPWTIVKETGGFLFVQQG